MKHLKTFEAVKYAIRSAWDSMIGEYVVLRNTRNNKYTDFLENNIGIIDKVYYPGAWVKVVYDNPPDYIQKFLNNKGEFNIFNLMRFKNSHISNNSLKCF